MLRKGKNLPKGKKLAAKGLKRIDTEKAFGKAVVGGTNKGSFAINPKAQT